MIEGTNDFLEIATTRPETLFGDTAVAVNPKDERYANLIGKNVILPIVGKLIPIVGDEHADPEVGTGCVKITPAHDPNDFEVGNRHNLERVIIMNANGTMNELTGKYNGMDRFACRKQLIEDLKEADLLIDIKKMMHSVGHSERSDAVVEPRLSKQWFVKMRPLADRVLDNQKDTDNKVNFIPERYEKTMNHWMEITYDWCISRQLWWGHQVPAWYRGEEVYVGYEAPEGEGWVQDEDVLDTWFSSALWPFSTLGWPEKTDMLERYYPNDANVTGYDIIPFWVNRMTFQGLEFLNKRPFENTVIHGLIRAKDGRKMSKSLGNGVDPMDVIEEYGADSLRFYLTTTSAPGMDLKYDPEKVISTANFANKLWNASRFVLMNLDGFEEKTYDNLSEADKWILTKLNKTIETVRRHMEKFEFNVVGTELYSFIWNDFCDWYIELAKINPTNTTKTVLLDTLTAIIKMLHPFMPYITEEIYQALPMKDAESIMISTYPTSDKNMIFEDNNLDIIIDLITRIRKAKLENRLGRDFVISHNNEIIKLNQDIIGRMTKCENFEINYSNDSLTTIEIPFADDKIKISYDGTMSEEEIENLRRDADKLRNSIQRRSNLLNNQNYVAKAPANIVEADRQALAKEENELKLIEEKLNNL